MIDVQDWQYNIVSLLNTLLNTHYLAKQISVVLLHFCLKEDYSVFNFFLLFHKIIDISINSFKYGWGVTLPAE